MQRALNIFKDIRSFFTIRKIFKKLKPDIVHTNGAKSGLLGRLAAASVGVKIILHTYHGHVFHSYFNPLVSSVIIKVERWLAKLSTKIIAISDQQKKELLDVYRICEEDKLVVIKLGINTDKFLDQDGLKRNAFRQKYAVKENEIAVGIIGRMVPVKGHAFFAEVVEEIIKRSVTQIRFFVIGDGMIRKDLEKRLPDVVFTSWILNIEEAMAGLDIIVLTSLNEGTPVTLLEAQAAAKPVVATNVGAVSEVVLDGETGFVVNYGEVKEFADKIWMLAENAALRTSMGTAGRTFMEKEHTKKQQFQAIQILYAELLPLPHIWK
jgi:glycosyltransferase involved in cell wall biosynthesis